MKMNLTFFDLSFLVQIMIYVYYCIQVRPNDGWELLLHWSTGHRSWDYGKRCNDY